MRKLALTILTASIALAAGHARAQTYDPAFPVCLHVVSFRTSPYYRCSYTTMDQCRASANGQLCVPNPYYAGATARGTKRHNPAKQARQPCRRSTTGLRRTINPMILTMELPKVTHRARKNGFSEARENPCDG